MDELNIWQQLGHRMFILCFVFILIFFVWILLELFSIIYFLSQEKNRILILVHSYLLKNISKCSIFARKNKDHSFSLKKGDNFQIVGSFNKKRKTMSIFVLENDKRIFSYDQKGNEEIIYNKASLKEMEKKLNYKYNLWVFLNFFFKFKKYYKK